MHVEAAVKVLSKIETLRVEKTSKKIEQLLLNDKLGKVYTDPGKYQFIGTIRLSWLVVEAYLPGFIKWMWMHPNEYVVHHKDGNPLNNAYVNLQVMKRSAHVSMHNTDLKYKEANRIRSEKISKSLIAYNADPNNAEDIENRHKEQSKLMIKYHDDPNNAEDIVVRYENASKSLIDWWKDKSNIEIIKARNMSISESLFAYNFNPANVKDIRARHKKCSKTKRKVWLVLDIFEGFFTVEEYAKASEVGYGTAHNRLAILLEENQITCERRLVDRKWKNVYVRKEA